MKHRWGKGKKDANKLPNGASITFLKVGGRTSAVVPSVQKKTGAVAGDAGISEQEDDEETECKPNAKQRRNPNTASNKAAVNGSKRGRGKKEEQAEDVKQEEEEEGKEDEPAPKRTKKGGAKKGANGAAANVAGQKAAASEPEGGRRRSSRNK